jgi:adenosine/AMP kinase
LKLNKEELYFVVDGFKSKGIETETDVDERKHLLRKIGYKV